MSTRILCYLAALFPRGADVSLDLQMERDDELIVIESVASVNVDSYRNREIMITRTHEISHLDSIP